MIVSMMTAIAGPSTGTIIVSTFGTNSQALTGTPPISLARKPLSRLRTLDSQIDTRGVCKVRSTISSISSVRAERTSSSIDRRAGHRSPHAARLKARSPLETRSPHEDSLGPRMRENLESRTAARSASIREIHAANAILATKDSTRSPRELRESRDTSSGISSRGSSAGATSTEPSAIRRGGASSGCVGSARSYAPRGRSSRSSTMPRRIQGARRSGHPGSSDVACAAIPGGDRGIDTEIGCFSLAVGRVDAMDLVAGRGCE
ncbi:hypothetical protein KM043_004149 [Ampulex compressa]|nr:hypothetical protein KM043_004149 [Ampulex compressa]